MDIRRHTSRIEPWRTLVLAPIIQEFIFRFLPYELVFLRTGDFWTTGATTAIAFSVIHWYFGKWFMLYALVWGVILWWVMVSFGFIAVVVIHATAKAVHLRFGIGGKKTHHD